MRKVLLTTFVLLFFLGSLSAQNKVKSIDHIVINVADMERALAF